MVGPALGPHKDIFHFSHGPSSQTASRAGDGVREGGRRTLPLQERWKLS